MKHTIDARQLLKDEFDRLCNYPYEWKMKEATLNNLKTALEEAWGEKGIEWFVNNQQVLAEQGGKFVWGKD